MNSQIPNHQLFKKKTLDGGLAVCFADDHVEGSTLWTTTFEILLDCPVASSFPVYVAKGEDNDRAVRRKNTSFTPKS